MKVRILPDAETEIQTSATWYEARRPGLSKDFLAELSSAIYEIRQDPERFAQLETSRTRRTYRRCLLRRFPYVIVFEVGADEIIIHAVAHAKRHPNYWQDRTS